MVIDGKALATNILDDLKKRVGELQNPSIPKGTTSDEGCITPHLMVILVGNDASSTAYVRQKELKTELINAEISVLRYGEDITENQLLLKLNELNEDPTVHGIIVQRPLPPHIDPEKITHATNPKKDVDGFHPDSRFTPPIALAIEKILEEIKKQSLISTSLSQWLTNKTLVVIGKGQTAGTPIINYLKKQNIQPIVIDSKTENKDALLHNADIIISAVGKPHILKAELLKRGVILIGVGMDRGEDERMHPDYDEDEIAKIASFYTPVPGGVGPVNVAMLLSNLVVAASNVASLKYHLPQ